MGFSQSGSCQLTLRAVGPRAENTSLLGVSGTPGETLASEERNLLQGPPQRLRQKQEEPPSPQSGASMRVLCRLTLQDPVQTEQRLADVMRRPAEAELLGALHPSRAEATCGRGERGRGKGGA